MAPVPVVGSQGNLCLGIAQAYTNPAVEIGNLLIIFVGFCCQFCTFSLAQAALSGLVKKCGSHVVVKSNLVTVVTDRSCDFWFAFHFVKQGHLHKALTAGHEHHNLVFQGLQLCYHGGVSRLQVFRLALRVNIVREPIGIMHRNGISFPFTQNTALGFSNSAIKPFQRQAEFLGVHGNALVHIPYQDFTVFPQGVTGIEKDIACTGKSRKKE